ISIMPIFVLTSDSLSRYPENQPHDFRVYLPKPLELHGNWTVSLNEFSVDSGKLKNELYVYCNLCDDSCVVDRKIPLLRRVSMKRPTNQIFALPYRIPIRLTHVSEIHVYIKDRNHAPASFLTGTVTLTLTVEKR
ncbi:hypothetical protein BOW00_12350, partial [Solemya velum gill symbiont]